MPLVALTPVVPEINHHDLANRVKNFWLFVIFDTAGEVMFVTISTLIPQLFKHLANLHGAHLALRQQDHFW
jgi:hypothetical protein